MSIVAGGIEARGIETIREEWRVTGKPGNGYPAYDFTFGSELRRAFGEDADPEAAARRFVDLVAIAGGGWLEGPNLSSRVIVETPWREESTDR